MLPITFGSIFVNDSQEIIEIVRKNIIYVQSCKLYIEFLTGLKNTIISWLYKYYVLIWLGQNNTIGTK